MASRLQFHATPLEIAAFARAVASSNGLVVTAVSRWSEWPVAVLPSGFELIHIEPLLPELGWLFLTGERPVLTTAVVSDFSFVQQNEDRMSFQIHSAENGMLDCSSLVFSTHGARAGLFRRISRQLRKSLSKGGWLYSPANGLLRFLPSRLYSSGALDAARRGLRLRDAGNVMFFPGELELPDEVARLAEVTCVPVK
jgi:hypothetical protein